MLAFLGHPSDTPACCHYAAQRGGVSGSPLGSGHRRALPGQAPSRLLFLPGSVGPGV